MGTPVHALLCPPGTVGKILFGKHADTEIKVEGKEQLIRKEDDVRRRGWPTAASKTAGARVSRANLTSPQIRGHASHRLWSTCVVEAVMCQRTAKVSAPGAWIFAPLHCRATTLPNEAYERSCRAKRETVHLRYQQALRSTQEHRPPFGPCLAKRFVLTILMNATEATPDGAALIEIRLSKGPRFVAVSFMGHGSGIPAELVARACEPFLTTQPRALGLGLTNASRTARTHGGWLKVVPREGCTELQLSLPLR